MTVKALRDKALSLPVSEKLSLVEDLWDSIAKDQQSLPLSENHARIIEDRLIADEEGRGGRVSWADVVKEVRHQVKRKKKK